MGRLQNPHTTLLVSIHFNCYTKNIHTLHSVVKAVLAPCLLKEYLSSNIIALPNILILDILCANVIWVLVYHWNGWQFGEARISVWHSPIVGGSPGPRHSLGYIGSPHSIQKPPATWRVMSPYGRWMGSFSTGFAPKSWDFVGFQGITVLRISGFQGGKHLGCLFQSFRLNQKVQNI